MRKQHFVFFVIVVVVAGIVGAAWLLTDRSAQGQPTPTIAFTTPAAFQCGRTIQWRDLQNWVGTTGACRAELLYSVVGIVTGAPVGATIKAEIWVNDEGSVWPAYGGGIVSVGPGGNFQTGFCISSKGPAREFWFQLFDASSLQNQYQRRLDRPIRTIGPKCVVTVAAGL